MDYIDSVIGLVGLVIAVVTLWKVQSVRRAQENERKLLRTLYGTEALGRQLRTAANHMAKSRDTTVRDLASDLLRTCGQIEGVSRALDAAHRGPAVSDTGVRVVQSGYFTQDFLRKTADAASASIDIVVFRPMIVSTEHALAGLRAAARRGVRIRLLSLSSESPDDALQAAVHLMPWAAMTSAAELRPQLAQAERRIANHVQSTWSAADRAKFSHRRYQGPPSVHMARSDSTINVGFVHLLSLESNFASLEDRPHLEVATDSKLGVYFLAHFEQLWISCNSDAPSGLVG